MKKIISYCFIAIFALVLVGCKKYTLTLTAATSENTVAVGNTLTLTPTTDYEGAEFEWSSSDPAIATVQDGVVMGVSSGTVEITVTVAKIKKSAKIQITVTSKVYTAAEMKTLLTARNTEFAASKNGSIKIVSAMPDKSLTSELVYNYTNDGIDSFMFKLSGSESGHIYVKEGNSYMFMYDVKSKSPVTAAEATNIKDNYGYAKTVSDFTKFYSDDKFFDNLSAATRENDVLTYTLDLTKYNGTTFVTEGKDSITLKVTLQNEKVTKAEIIVVENAKTYSTSLTYESVGQVVAITYPTDLDSYIG